MTQQPDSPEAARPEAEQREAGASSEEPVYTTGGVRLAVLLGMLVVIGLWAGLPILIFILALVLMIFLHELGHFMTARWTGMKATEFFIGFGPRVWSFRRGDTEYGLKAIPAGAYVRIIGMNNLEEVRPEDEPQAYRNKTFPRKLLVVCAGSLMHFALAFLVALVLLVGFGVPDGRLIMSQGTREENWVIREVTPGSGAAEASLESGDRILAWDGEPISTFEDIQEGVDGAAIGETVTLTVDRDGEVFDVNAELRDRASVTDEDVPEGMPFLGIGPEYVEPPKERLGLIPGIGRAAMETGNGMRVVVDGIGYLFSPSGLGNFAQLVSEAGQPSENPAAEVQPNEDTQESSASNEGRPMSILGVVMLGGEAWQQLGVASMLFLFFMVNIFVGMFNMIPLVPFDGGHAAVAIYERLRSRGGTDYRVDYAKLMPVAYAVVMALIVLFSGALYLDIVSPVKL